MAKEKKWEEFSATYKDVDGDEHTSTVLAHVVTEDTKGEILVIGGSRHTVPGDVIVETSQPNVYDVLSAEAWKTTGYGGAEAPAEAPARRGRG